MTAPIYGPWIAHNATPDSTCPPDAVGKRGQLQRTGESRLSAENKSPRKFSEYLWNTVPMADCQVAAYRLLQEPVRGKIIQYLAQDPNRNDTHIASFPTLDGSLVCGRFAQVDDAGALVKDGAIVSVGAV